MSERSSLGGGRATGKEEQVGIGEGAKADSMDCETGAILVVSQ